MMSSALVSRSVPLPSSIKTTQEEASGINIEKQGIVTILGKDLEITRVPPSLRRPLSADMSSKNFLSQNGGFSPMKRIASSEEIATLSSKGDDDEQDFNNIPSHDDVWRSIQSQKEKKEDVNPTQLNSGWSSLLSEKANNETNILPPPPYVHPLVKKSSTLNEKSLEICTESLGSETGSDEISCPPSETEEDKVEATTKQQRQGQNDLPMQIHSFDDVKVSKYNYDPSKKMSPKSFPPPLPSLASKDGPSVHVQSHRTNGRLVLEAVSVPQIKYFQTERQEGRLVLTLVNDSQDSTQEAMDDKAAIFEEIFDNFEEMEGAHEVKPDEDDFDEEDEEEEEEAMNKNGMNEVSFFMEQSSSSLPTSGMLNVHRSALMMKRLMGLGNRDPTWSNKGVELMEEQVVAPPTIPQSLPPQLPPFNAYDYFWRNNSSTYADQEYTTNLKGNNNKIVLAKINDGLHSNEQQENMVLVKGNNGDYMVPFIKGCKENRRSLPSWQPHCIATS